MYHFLLKLFSLNMSRFWAEFDPDRQMVDICRGGIIPRVSSEQALEGLEASSVSHVNEHDSTYDSQVLQRWEFEAICVIDPFIRVRVSVDICAENLFLMERYRMLQRVSRHRCLRDSRRNVGVQRDKCVEGCPIKEEVAM